MPDLLVKGAVVIMLGAALGVPASVRPDGGLHYTANGNFGEHGEYRPGAVGFNLADVSSVAQLAFLPPAAKGLAWVGQCNGADAAFISSVRPYIGSSRLFGFFLMDDPDPRSRLAAGRMSPPCTAENLRAEADWIHVNVPGAKVFIALMNMASSEAPSFEGTYTPDNSHVDLFGIAPYPCRTDLHVCDYAMIDRHVSAATSAGIPRDSIVPIYQAFGGGAWHDDSGGHYRLPTGMEERQILSRWEKLVQMPVFDFAYSWGSQKQDIGLEAATELRAVLAEHNNSANLVAPE